MKERVLEILMEVNPSADFSISEDFIEDGLMDSFNVIELVSLIEREFDITISGLEVVPENFSSVEKIVDLINRTKENG